MQVLYSFSYLLKQFSALGFGDPPLRVDIFAIIIERNAIHIVGYEIDLFGSVNQFVHLDDVWMINFFKNCDLSLNSLPFHGISQLVLLIHL